MRYYRLGKRSNSARGLSRTMPPSKGAWLNMAGIEITALARQCLDRCIPTLALLGQPVMVWADARILDRKTVHLTFSQNDARDKVHRHYRHVQKFMCKTTQ